MEMEVPGKLGAVTEQPTVLIADDEPGARTTLEIILADSGYRAETALTGEQALARARAGPLDAALVDVSLPDLSGTEVLTALKKLDPDMVVIMVTGQASLESSVNALNAGAAGYIIKPVDMDELLAMLRSALDKRRLERENREMLRQLILLYGVGRALAQSLDMEPTFNDSLEIVLVALGAEAGAVWVCDLEGNSLKLLTHRGLPKADFERVRWPEPLDGMCAVELTTAEPVWQGASRQAEGETTRLELCCMPVRAGGALKGVLGVVNPRQGRSFEDNRKLLEAVGGQMGVAIENMLLFQALQRAHQDLRETQAQLVQSEKLSAVGRLVSGVAHELNNPLGVVIGFAQYLSRVDADEEMLRIYQHIYEQAKRCSRTVDNLLTFARRYESERVRTDVNETVRASLELLRYQLRVHSIEVEAELDPNLPPILADPHRLQQVFVNIIANAYQSMAGQGHPGRLRVSSGTDGDRIRVSFADTGPGIAAENLPKVFEPFFTTKDVGQGTGLGLSISYGIIQEHGGRIRVESQQGQGATFIVELPLIVAAEAQPPTPEEQGPSLECLRGRRVLVVDDEEGMVALMERIMKSAQAQVAAVSDGEAALAEALVGDFDLVIADLKMPKMDGPHFYELLRVQRPELARRVIFCSGDTVNPETTCFLTEARRPYLNKPFTVEELAVAVQEVLEE